MTSQVPMNQDKALAGRDGVFLSLVKHLIPATARWLQDILRW